MVAFFDQALQRIRALPSSCGGAWQAHVQQHSDRASPEPGTLCFVIYMPCNARNIWGRANELQS